MMKIRPYMRSKIILIFLHLLFYSCERPNSIRIFPEMKSHYPDVLMSSDFYFIKNFGLEQNASYSNSKPFWKLKNDSMSYFHYSCFLTNDNGRIILVKKLDNHDYDDSKVFLDFNAKVNQTWLFVEEIGKKIEIRDSVSLRKKVIIEGDTIYSFHFKPHLWYKKNNRVLTKDKNFRIDVSRRRGITSILSTLANENDTLIFVQLYPQVMVRNKMGSRLLL